jgi:hypothetical protein
MWKEIIHAYLNDMKNKRVFYKRTDFVNDACEKERGKKVQVFKMSL